MPGRGNRSQTKASIHPNLISMKRVITSREGGQSGKEEEEDAEALAGDQWMTNVPGRSVPITHHHTLKVTDKPISLRHYFIKASISLSITCSETSVAASFPNQCQWQHPFLKPLPWETTKPN